MSQMMQMILGISFLPIYPQPPSPPVMDSVIRLQQFGPQVSDGHLLLLKRGEVLLGVWGSDAMVVPAQVVGCQAGSPAEHAKESGKGRVSLSAIDTSETFGNVKNQNCSRQTAICVALLELPSDSGLLARGQNVGLVGKKTSKRVDKRKKKGP